ncbi:MAG: serine hydrolase domain-containing protein [Ilumatobacteraceae bacterium]
MANVAAAVIRPDGGVDTIGDVEHRFRLASIAKVLSAWATLIAVEEGIVALDQPAGQPGCTLRHLLSHAGGYPFDGVEPISPPARRRIYSNRGIELAASIVADTAAMPFADYLREAVLEPLGMASTELRGSPAHGCWSTVDDMVAFAVELRDPHLISAATAADATSIQFPDLAGLLPGFGRYDPCPWGLGAEIRGLKTPHWTGSRNSPGTFGHFGGAGTVLWVDPGVAVACVALTDRPFDEWADEAKRAWPALADAVIAEATA